MNANRQEEILVIPKECVAERQRFTPWSNMQKALQSAERKMAWTPREQAEGSTNWVQPIPCAMIRGKNHTYHVFRRTRRARAELRSRISLVAGGHIDREDGNDGEATLSRLVRMTLRREIAEELGVELIGEPEPIGMVIDLTSAEKSKHVAFVHEAVITQRIRLRTKEFSTQSRVVGKLYTRPELVQFRQELDPWSAILFDDHISASLGTNP